MADGEDKVPNGVGPSLDMKTTDDETPKDDEANNAGAAESDKAATAAAAATTTEDSAEDEEPVLKDLVILSPKVSNNESGAVDRVIYLPVLQPSEPVQSLRTAVADVLGFAQLTRFRFEIERTRPDKLIKMTERKDVPLVSPYTSEHAMTSLPATGKDNILDEIGDLSVIKEDGWAIRIALETYDAGSVNDHILRLRYLFAGNAPSVVQLFDPDPAPPAAATPEEAPTSTKKSSAKEASKEESKQEQPLQQKKLPDLKVYDQSNALLDPTNIQDFFYLANGEEASDFLATSSKKKKKRKDEIPRFNALDEESNVKCTIVYSGFHPPPPQRRLMGDLAYLLVTFPDGDTANVTACRMGFYINKTIGKSFDPAPTAAYCFSHALLDCLLLHSASLRDSWSRAIEAGFEKSEISGRTSHINTFFHTAIRGDFTGFANPASAAAATSQAACSWLVPVNNKYETSSSSWNRNELHSFNPARANEFLTFGVDLRSASPRDWNEELQLARELPVGSFSERLERARVLYKIQHDFAEASLAAVNAIANGHIEAMNTSEPTASAIYLWNNIFVSTAHDGPDTFKTLVGDRAAKKTASRDVQCIGTLQRLENANFSTLATLLIDYLGTRYVCQSVLPGILVGEKAHTLLYGAVDSTSPLKSDESFRKVVEDKIGEALKLASRPILAQPLNGDDTEKSNDYFETTIPIEAKGIKGSDNRQYILEICRLTPRDPNWIPESEGGTGLIEGMEHDDELCVSVLRPELVTRFVQTKLGERVTERKLAKATETSQNDENGQAERENGNMAADDNGQDKGVTETNESSAVATKDGVADDDQAKASELQSIADSDIEFLNKLRPNLNVFLPNMRRFDGIDEKIAQQITDDDNFVRDMGTFLWSKVIPQVVALVRSSNASQVYDGRSLCEYLHRHGVNCRYMGRIAQLACAEEQKDEEVEQKLRNGKETQLLRKTMPKWWLELLECEMIARSAKHVLNDYLTEKGGVATTQPIQAISSLLCALVSEYEESAAQTETRMNRRPKNGPDEDDVGALTVAGAFHNSDAIALHIRSRSEVWTDILSDMKRRFRYTPSLFNNGTGKCPRAIYPSLLRRVCQLTGIRIVARQYEFGGGCVCGGSTNSGGRMLSSYPISPLDIVDVIPLMKHSAAYGEGKLPCSYTTSPSPVPPLQVFLPDARASLERAHIHAGSRAINKALELAQEAATLYTRVSDNSAHPGAIESFELIGTILLEYGDPVNAVAQGSRVLSLAIQSQGFDSHTALTAHLNLAQMLMGSREYDAAVKHIRAGIYLLEILSGPRHVELFTSYHKLGSVYASPEYEKRYLDSAIIFFNEARKRDSADRLMDGLMAKNTAKVLESLENYKGALGVEQSAFKTLRLFLGPDHSITKESDASLARLTKMAVAVAQSSQNEHTTAAAAAASTTTGATVKKPTKKKNGKKKK